MRALQLGCLVVDIIFSILLVSCQHRRTLYVLFFLSHWYKMFRILRHGIWHITLWYILKIWFELVTPIATWWLSTTDSKRWAKTVFYLSFFFWEGEKFLREGKSIVSNTQTVNSGRAKSIFGGPAPSRPSRWIKHWAKSLGPFYIDCFFSLITNIKAFTVGI